MGMGQSPFCSRTASLIIPSITTARQILDSKDGVWWIPVNWVVNQTKHRMTRLQSTSPSLRSRLGRWREALYAVRHAANCPLK